MEKIEKQEPYLSLTLQGEYDNFTDFYDTNKKTIYEAIIETFGGFYDSENDKLKLVIFSKINDFEWETEFNFDRNDFKILNKDILPYFESLEDYENCLKIKKLYNDFEITKK